MKKIAISLTAAVFIFCSTSYAYCSTSYATAKENKKTEGLKGVALGLRPLMYVVPQLNNFEVVERVWFWKRTSGIEGNALSGLGAFLLYGFTENIGIEGSYDLMFGGGLSDSTGGLSFQLGSLSAIAMFLTDQSFRPYLKAGACYGQFDWEGPGDFDGGFGWQGGAGFEFVPSESSKNSSIGIEVLYRGLTNDYNAPSNAIASDDSIDLSGINTSIDLIFRF